MITLEEEKPEFMKVTEVAKRLKGRLTNRHSGKELSYGAIHAAIATNAKVHDMVELVMDDDGCLYVEIGEAVSFLKTHCVMDGAPLAPVPNDEMVVTSEFLDEFMKKNPINPSSGKPAPRSKVRSSIQNGASYGFYNYAPLSRKKSLVGRYGVIRHLNRVYPNTASIDKNEIDSVGTISTEESESLSSSYGKEWEAPLIEELSDTISIALQTLKAAEREENLTWKFQGYNEAKQFLQSGMDAFEASPATDSSASEQSEFLF